MQASVAPALNINTETLKSKWPLNVFGRVRWLSGYKSRFKSVYLRLNEMSPHNRKKLVEEKIGAYCMFFLIIKNVFACGNMNIANSALWKMQ